jgi:hypothetical protein
VLTFTRLLCPKVSAEVSQFQLLTEKTIPLDLNRLVLNSKQGLIIVLHVGELGGGSFSCDWVEICGKF